MLLMMVRAETEDSSPCVCVGFMKPDHRHKYKTQTQLYPVPKFIISSYSVQQRSPIISMSSFSIALWSAAAALMITAGLSGPPRPLTTTKVTTCDSLGNVHRLSCEYGVISVLTVLYGRLDRETCSEGWASHVSDISCVQHGSKDILQKRCDGKTFCEVNADLFRFSDPCFGTYKYLETTYACVAPPLRSVACEDSIAHLRCEQGQVIEILAADYGRQDTTTCSFDRPPAQLTNVECTSPDTMGKVAKMCNGRSSCSVKATYKAFGDPCQGTYKYLQVEYQCGYALV